MSLPARYQHCLLSISILCVTRRSRSDESSFALTLLMWPLWARIPSAEDLTTNDEEDDDVMKSKVAEILKEVIACDVSPVAMFYSPSIHLEYHGTFSYCSCFRSLMIQQQPRRCCWWPPAWRSSSSGLLGCLRRSRSQDTRPLGRYYIWDTVFAHLGKFLICIFKVLCSLVCSMNSVEVKLD